MIDIHSHIIFGVDDGPSNMEQSTAMICHAEKAGIEAIVATPHSHEPLFDNERLTDNYQELLYRIRSCNISLKLGYEVFINPAVQVADWKNMELTLDGSRYLLFELPFNASPRDGFDLLHAFRLKDIIPIIAHPERNRNFLHNFNELSGYLNAGCMIQIDAASVLGVYGRDVREYVKRLVKLNQVDFVASNAHCPEDYANWYRKAFNEVSKWTGDENARRLFKSNAQGILKREEKMHAV
jgi:protein-tyrosine phosphatase